MWPFEALLLFPSTPPDIMHRMCFSNRVIVGLFLVLISGMASAADESFDPNRFEVTVLATGMKRPMEMDIAPDGTIYFIELEGRLRAYDPGTREITEVGEVTITTAQENGLIGLALDPNFAETQWIFLQYSPPDFSGQHISRFTLKDGKLDLESEKVLLKYEEQRKECCHHAGSLHFGPRGELFISTGDNTHPHGDSQGYAPIDERSERSPWDAQKSAANTNSYNGKILRIRPTPEGGYEIPEGNLFPADGSQGRPEIYVMGCRNPWRMTVDSETGFVYWGEVGPDASNDGPRGPRGYDEINQARRAGNFGWPYFIADNRPYADVNFETGEIGARYDVNAPVNESPNNTGARVLPPAQPALLYYPYADSPEFPELGKGGRTACAGPVYHYPKESKSPTRFPAAYDKCLFVYEWTRHWIKVVHLDAKGDVVSIEPFMPEYNFVRPIDMAFGRDGVLYAIEYGETWGENPDTKLIRIDYVRGNRPPIVVAKAENNIGRQPLEVTLSSEGTFDKDANDKLSYVWRLTSNVDPQAAPKVVSQDASATITIEDAGIYNAELVVTDSEGVARAATVPILVGNSRPVIQFDQPREGDFYDDSRPIEYRLIVKDREDGTNIDEIADAEDLDLLDPDSPTRVTVNALFSPGSLSSGDSTGKADAGPPGLRRMKSSDCFNCHAVDQKRVGPPLLDIANKYRGKDGALEASVQRVLKGSTGAWGKVPMSPHSHHTVDEIREMVSWIYSLEPTGLVRVFNGFVGGVPVSKDEATKVGYYTLEASYLDLGAGAIPPLSTTATVHLRQRLVEAEDADEIQGPRILGGGGAGGGKMIGAVAAGHTLRFRGIRMDDVGGLTFKVTSAGAGGTIEVHLDEPDGPLLATAEVEVNGAWDKWYDRTVQLPVTQGRHDVVLKFTHPNNAGGLMNLDSVNFLPPQAAATQAGQ